MRHTRPDNAGFTLLEVVIALTILAGNCLIAKKEHLEAQAQAIKTDTSFRSGLTK